MSNIKHGMPGHLPAKCELCQPYQTAREQLAEILMKYVEDGINGLLPMDYYKSSSSGVDAILAVFTGLPAMQHKHMSGDVADKDLAAWNKWNIEEALRRQILAELGETK